MFDFSNSFVSGISGYAAVGKAPPPIRHTSPTHASIGQTVVARGAIVCASRSARQELTGFNASRRPAAPCVRGAAAATRARPLGEHDCGSDPERDGDECYCSVDFHESLLTTTLLLLWTRRKCTLTVLALILSVIATSAQSPSTTIRGTWAATAGPNQVLQGTWTADLAPANPR